MMALYNKILEQNFDKVKINDNKIMIILNKIK